MMLFSRLLTSIIPVALLTATAAPSWAQQSNNGNRPRLLMFTGTAGYRHESIPTAIQVITSNDTFSTTHTEDPKAFDDLDKLKAYDALVFVSTTDPDPPAVGKPITDTGAINVGKYIQQGGNFVGVHAAANVLYQYPYYGRIVGAVFDFHNPLQPATIQAATADHPSTRNFGTLNITEEVYHFKSDPRQLATPANVLLNPVFDGQPNISMPLAWWREGGLLNDKPGLGPSVSGLGLAANISDAASLTSGGAGRSFFSSLGHLNETWRNPVFQQHVFGGISWAVEKSNASSTYPAPEPPSDASEAQRDNSAGSNAGSAAQANAAMSSSITSAMVATALCAVAIWSVVLIT